MDKSKDYDTRLKNIERYSLSVGICLCCLLSSCLDADEWSNIEIGRPSLDLAFPLLSETILSDDLVAQLGDSIELIINSDGVYAAVFHADPVIRTKQEIFPKTTLGFPIPILDSLTTLPIPTFQEADPVFATLKGDNLRFILNSNQKESIQIELMIAQVTKDGEPFQMSYTIPFSGDTLSTLVTPVIDLNGYDLDFSTGAFTLKYIARGSDGKKIVLPLSFAQIDAFDFAFVQGQIKRTVFDSDEETINVEVKDTLVEGDYEFFDPLLHFDFTNSFGFPIGVKVKEALVIRSDGSTNALTSILFDDLIYLDYPESSDIGTFASNRITVDRDNSNIADIASDDIKTIKYDLDIFANPESENNEQFFLTDSSYARLDVQLELAFDAHIQSIRLLEDIDVMLEELDSVTFLRLKLVVDNGIPLAFIPELAFTNAVSEEELVLIPEAGSIIGAASVGSDDVVNGSGNSTIFFRMDEADLSQLQHMTKLMLKLEVKSPENGERRAIIQPGQELSVAIGAEVKTK